MHLGPDRDAHGGGARHDEHDPGDPGQPGTQAPGAAGGGAYPACGQETTTRNPAMRRHAPSGKAAVPSSAFPRVFYSVSLIFRW